MHILLLILKIIGIILLILLGIVLLLVLLLLFVPFCYRAEGSYYEEKPYAMARIRYLFPFFQVFVRYKDGQPEGKVKVFGITVYDLFAAKEDANEKKKDSSVKKQDPKESQQNSPASEELKTAEPLPEPGLLIEEEESIVPEEEKLTFADKIRKFISVIRNKFREWIEKLRDFKAKGIAIKEKVTYYYEIWQREETQRAFKTAQKTLYKLWKSIRPKKGLLKLHFGTGDPGSTGQICGYFGMLYPFLGKYVMIEPDFENKIYEGDFYFKGRITLFVFLKVAWVVLFDKDIKTLRKIFMN